ncbi:MAG: AAA family ATPase, partial [Gemmatimonadota bacterium]
LFDEIEKAHPDVFNILLQVLDEGRLTDGQGRVVDFRNTVLILTSNIGSQHIVEAGEVTDAGGWQIVEGQVLNELRRHFRPEFLNRVDDIVVFRPLSREQIADIVGLQLVHLEKLLAARELKLEATPAARAFLAEKGYDPIYGARPLKRVIQRLLQNPIALTLLEGGYAPGDTVLVDRQGDGLGFTRVESGAAAAVA